MLSVSDARVGDHDRPGRRAAARDRLALRVLRDRDARASHPRGGGGGEVTVTGAVSVADTSGPPPTGVPVAVALLTKLDCTLAREHV